MPGADPHSDMRHVPIDDVDPVPYDDGAYHTDRRPLGDVLGTEHVAVTRYVLEPGERFSGSVHAHLDQEEVFVILRGTATFEVDLIEGYAVEAEEGGLADTVEAEADGQSATAEITVGPKEAIRFAPGEFQSGYNAAEESLEALAIGAPRDAGEIHVSRIPVLDDRDVACPDCGRGSLRIPTDGKRGLVCPDCGGTAEIE